MLGEQVGDETPVVVGDAIHELGLCQVLALALELGGHDDVHAVGLAVDMLVDPAQLLLELLRRECHTAENPESTRIAHRGDHIAAMAEGEQREVDTVLVTNLRFHPPSMRRAIWPTVIGALGSP